MRVGGAGTGGGLGALVAVKYAGEDLAWPLFALLRGEGDTLVRCGAVSEVEVVLGASSREGDVEALPGLGAGEDGVGGVDGGALGAVDGARVAELDVLLDVCGRKDRSVAAVAASGGRGNQQGAVGVDAADDPAVAVLDPPAAASAQGSVVVAGDDAVAGAGVVPSARRTSLVGRCPASRSARACSLRSWTTSRLAARRRLPRPAAMSARQAS